MNPDDLISKYLDGELLEDEDRKLRAILSDNPVAKEEFDEAVIINSALRDDALSIVPPMEFLLETEERILMKILSTYPVSTDRVYSKPKSKTRYFAAAVVAVILFGVIRLGDNLNVNSINSGFGVAVNNYRDNLDDEMLTHTYIISKDVSAKYTKPNRSNVSRQVNLADNNKKTLESNVRLATNDQSEILAENNTNKDNSDNKALNSTGTNDKPVNIHNSELNFKTEPSANINFTAPAIDLALGQLDDVSKRIDFSQNISLPAMKQINLQNMMIGGISNYNQDITVSSFLGTDIMKDSKEKDKKAFNHISQSLAYSFSGDDKLGVEFGYTEYSVKDVIGSDFVAANMAPPIVKSANSQVQSAEGFNSSQGSNPYSKQSFVYNHTKQLYWGAAFYERTIIKTSDIALNFRLGVGSSSDGALGFGKIYAKYKVFSGFNLTVGSEGRLFMARFSGADNKDLLKKSISLIYGFQIVF